MANCELTRTNASSVSHNTNVESGSAVTLNADRLQGYSASDFIHVNDNLPISLTLETGTTTTEQVNCNYIVIGDFCYVNLAGITSSENSLHTIAINVPRALCRCNTIIYQYPQAGPIVFIDALGTTIHTTGAISAGYAYLIYPIARS